MSVRPLVAVVGYRLGGDRVARWPQGGFGVPAPFIECLWAAGARTAIIPPGEPGDPARLLEPFDGLLLVGGGDVDPARYGQVPGSAVYGVEPDRDDLECGLLRAADRQAVPTLCICRGVQVMNVAFGGTLHQHIPSIPGLGDHGVPIDDSRTMHEIKAAPGSRLAVATGGDVLSGSSHHHQGIDRLGAGLVATGWSEDGLVEAIEREEDSPSAPWMLGVQWHPEDTAAADEAQQSLFGALTKRAVARSSVDGAPRQRHPG
jgi:gamma-glutamyl-gamma-aminobutyrate hydrolase PuuD